MVGGHRAGWRVGTEPAQGRSSRSAWRDGVGAGKRPVKLGRSADAVAGGVATFHRRWRRPSCHTEAAATGFNRRALSVRD
jgi:hypothetical protein